MRCVHPYTHGVALALAVAFMAVRSRAVVPLKIRSLTACKQTEGCKHAQTQTHHRLFSVCSDSGDDSEGYGLQGRHQNSEDDYVSRHRSAPSAEAEGKQRTRDEKNGGKGGTAGMKGGSDALVGDKNKEQSSEGEINWIYSVHLEASAEAVAAGGCRLSVYFHRTQTHFKCPHSRR